MPEPIRFWFTSALLNQAEEGGKGRQAFAASRGLVSRYSGHNDGTKCESDHVIGAKGEIATATILSLEWKPNVGVLSAADIAMDIEVRTRRIPGAGRDLTLMKHDKPKIDRAFVLVHAYADCPQVVDVIGWIMGRDGMSKRYWRELERYKPHGVCFIPPESLRDMAELEQLIRERRVA